MHHLHKHLLSQESIASPVWQVLCVLIDCQNATKVQTNASCICDTKAARGTRPDWPADLENCLTLPGTA